MEYIKFDRLYIIGPTGNQYDDLKYKDIVFITEIKELSPPDKLPEDIKKQIIFDDVRARVPVVNENFCRGRHNYCNMIYINQNLFALDRQNVRENCIIFVLFHQRGKVLNRIYNDFLSDGEKSYNDFVNICTKAWKQRYNYFVINRSLSSDTDVKLRINWHSRVL